MAYIYLDAGHGGYDTGAEYQERLEKNDNLDLILAVGELLSQNGINVGYTRKNDIYDSSIRRAEMANESDADFFISIHRSNTELPNTMSGIKVSVFKNSDIHTDISNAVLKEFSKIGYNNLGIFVNKDIIELKETKMTALMVELGYINSNKDNDFIDNNFNETVYALANAIYWYLYNNDIPFNTFEDMLYPTEENL